jgi:hypothetical protein
LPMSKLNPQNERIKRDYFRYLKEARGKSDTTLDAARKAIARFEDYTDARERAAAILASDPVRWRIGGRMEFNRAELILLALYPDRIDAVRQLAPPRPALPSGAVLFVSFHA